MNVQINTDIKKSTNINFIDQKNIFKKYISKNFFFL